jgi:hypothetical protein
MGGNALKIAKVRRYERAEFDAISKEILDILKKECEIDAHVPKFYHKKETFGDLDVLVRKEQLYVDIKTLVQTIFNPTEIYKNGSVISFDYKEFQIDFIVTCYGDLETSKHYFSYNDLGNFMGRIAYKMGFRYGDYGLKVIYLHEDGGRKFSRIISKDPEKIFEFLGFDYQRYLEGFDDVEDIFEYVVNSKYFNRNIFDYDQLNHQNKTRNRKRKNYRLFLEYIQNLEDHTPYDFLSKLEYIERAEYFFNVEILEQINEWNRIVAMDKEVAKKFSGKHIIEKYGLQGKEVGRSIGVFKEFITDYLFHINSDKTYVEFILDTKEKDIYKLFEYSNKL